MKQATRLPRISRALYGPTTGMVYWCARTILAGAIGHTFLTTGIATIAALPLPTYAGDSASAISTMFSVRKNYDIPAGALEGALNRFGREAGILISFPTELMSGMKSKGLKGSYNVQEALPVLLQGTDLTAIIDGGAVTVHRTPHVAGAGADTTLPVVNVSSDYGTATEGSGSYAARLTSVGGKSAQALREVPQTVSVVTRQAIEDNGLTTLYDVMNTVPGISMFQGSMITSRYISRGFEISNYRVDGGTALYNSLFSTDWDMALYDHVEVLRGADGLFGGASEPGGAINLVRKKPTKERQIGVQMQLGSWNFKRAELDVSGPLTESGNVRGRAVLAHENRDFFYDVAHSERSLAYGIIEADISRDTTISMGLSYSKRDSSSQGYGLPRYKTGEDLGLPRSTYLSSAYDHANKTSTNIFAHVKHNLNPDWVIDLDLNHETADQYRYDQYFNGAIDPITNAGLASIPSDQHEKFTNKSIDLSAKGKFSLLGRQHELVLGGSWQNFQQNSYVMGMPSVAVNNIFSFNPYNYPYGPFTPRSRVDQRIEQSALYGSVRLHVTDPLHVILGARSSTYKYNYAFQSLNAAGGVASSSNTKYEDNRVITPYVAASYDLNKEWTVYASAAETFKSQANSLQGPLPGTPIDPVTGRNYEVGIKGEHWGGRLQSAVALYQIERTGAAVRDRNYPVTPGAFGSNCCFVGTGQIVSRGLDAELSGEFLPGLQLSASYNYNDNFNKNSTDARYQPLVPRHLIKLLGAYQLPGQYGRWKIGGSVNLQSETYVNDFAYLRNSNGTVSTTSVPYRITQGGYAVWNAFSEYKISEKWTAMLNVNNLFDKSYYSTVGYLDYGSFYGTPRNAMLTLRGKF